MTLINIFLIHPVYKRIYVCIYTNTDDEESVIWLRSDYLDVNPDKLK